MSLIFQIIEWFIPKYKDKYYRDEFSHNYDIIIYGITEKGETVNCIVTDYEPFFYVRVPLHLKKSEIRNKVAILLSELEDNEFEYTVKKYNSLETEKKVGLKKNEFEAIKINIISKKDFWGYSEDNRFFLKVKTKSNALFKTMQYIFEEYNRKWCEKNSGEWVLYETNIEPFIRFIHEKDIKPSGWLSINLNLVDNIDSNTNYSFMINYKDIEVINKKKIGPILIGSFDIECTSSHGDFPVAIKDYKKISQELCENVEKIINEDLYEIIKKSFDDNVIINNIKISILHAKRKPTLNQLDKLKENIPKIKSLLNEILENKNIKTQDIVDIETNINKKLTNILPELYGDPIIQIGTTFHKYGNNEIIYKSLINLGTCDKIEGVDVIECKNEEELLLKWKEMIMEKSPDIITGYNIMGFDFKYMYDRCIELNIYDKFKINFGKSGNIDCDYDTKSLYSAALGEVNTYFFKFEGILLIDLMVYVKSPTVLTLDNYKLDNVAENVLGEKKVDLKPDELFKKFLGSSKDRKEIGIYCIQDCELVNKIIQKMKVIENTSGMSNVCLVPISFIFHRGQGIKIYSLVMYECNKRNQVIPFKSYMNDTGYEGAIVLDPKTGIYIDDPIVVFDYSSLYPSSMIAENLSHDSYIFPKDLDKYVKNGKLISNDENKFLNIIKIDEINHYFVKYKDEKKSTIPQILEMLIKQRKLTRAKINYKLIKLKNNIEYIGLYNEKNLSIKDLDTNEVFNIKNKDDILSINDAYDEFEKDVFDSLQLAFKITANSLYGQTGAKTSPIYLKPIAECTTATGRNMIIKAKTFVEENYNADVIYGDSVMDYTPLVLKDDNNCINIIQFSDLNYCRWLSYDKSNSNKEQLFNPGYFIWTHNGWSPIVRFIRHKTIKKIYRIITNSGIIDVTEDHSLLNLNVKEIKPKNLKINDKILHSKIKTNKINKNIKSKLFNINDIEIYKEIQNFVLGTKYIKIEKINNNDYMIIDVNYKYNDEYKILEIIELHEKYEGYVYDIETKEGVFNAGIGNIVLKNTDSIFCKFPLKNKGKMAVKEAIDKGLEVEKAIAEVMKMYKPQALNYEKVLYPLILFSKKRYVGLLYEEDENKCKEKSMGIALKRRDYSKIMKQVYGAVINKILWENDLEGSFKILDNYLEKICNGDIELETLIISKTLKSTYKDPEKIAHKVLAERIGARDAGNKPAINDRLPYIYIENNNPKALQGEKIETIEYIKENNIKPDYLHYITNQIMKPVIQLYTLCIDQIPNYQCPKNYWDIIDKKLQNEKDLYKDDIKRLNRITNLKEKLVKELLFDKYIEKLEKPQYDEEGNILKKRTNTTYRVVKEFDLKCKKDELENIECNLIVKVSKVKSTITIKLNNEVKEIACNLNKSNLKDGIIIDTIANYIETNSSNYIKFKTKGISKLVKDYNVIKEIENTKDKYWIDAPQSILVMFSKIIPYFHRFSIQ